MAVPVALTIAGSDSSGAAGLQADLPTFAELGVEARSAVTVVTAQDSHSVLELHPVPITMVVRQRDVTIAGPRVGATKTGMLGRAEVIDVVLERVQSLGQLVVDPVCTDSSGRLMVVPDVVERYRELARHAAILTPNRREIEILAGLAGPVETADIIDRADQIRALGSAVVVVTGGRSDGEVVEDVVIGSERVATITAPRQVPGLPVRGTGCTFSAAITACLALGQPAGSAIEAAHAYVQERLALMATSVSKHGRPGLAHWAQR
jgi:hydroxymethylpyrimidine/phosphomethylpyrimidine kinase